ncbi:MAG: PAS domain S-box protein [bacterium]|nr:PAS domain S-box protein [bacterium]
MSSKPTYDELLRLNRELVNTVDKRERVENALHESQRQLTTLMSNLPGMAYRCRYDPDWTMEFVSDGCLSLTGYMVEELLENASIPYGDLIHPDDRQMVWDVVQVTLDEKRVFQITYRITTKRGETRWVWEQGQCITDEQGEIAALEGFITDITDQKLAEKRITQSGKFLDSIINGISDPIFVKDDMHRWIAFNDAFCKMLGYSRDELLGKSDDDFFPQGQVDEFWAHDDKVFASDEPDINEEEISLAGSTRIIVTLKSAFTNPITGKRNLVGTIRDITEQKRGEQELLKMQKLKSVGILAGGIAHDFNNVLMGLFGYVSLAKERLPEGDPVINDLEIAEQYMGRATRLTKQLLTFAKGGEPVKRNVSLSELVDSVVRFDLSGSSVGFIFKQDPDLWAVEVDQGQMQQVFSNLAINAKQAMPDGGHLEITMENVELARDVGQNLSPGRYVKVICKDDGIGIDARHIDRIFDPYFSTKQSGSGLGLAMTYSIISKHGGHITADSTAGEGAVFTLYLPASDLPRMPKVNKARTVSAVGKAGARVLMMDDEEGICLLAKEIMTSAGYSVETALDGDQAIAIYREFMEAGEPFDVVIMDLTIPGGMGGKEAVREILAIDADARVIVSSGYADDAVMSRFADYGFKDVAVKPYSPTKLLQILNRVLGD